MLLILFLLSFKFDILLFKIELFDVDFISFFSKDVSFFVLLLFSDLLFELSLKIYN